MATENAAEKQFWDRYVALAREEDVPEKSPQWYVRRVEDYIKFNTGKPLRTHGTSDVHEYLAQAGRDRRLKGWQFRQLVHALQILFTGRVRADWAASFDWRYWLESSKELEFDHPTVARHNSPMAGAATAADASGNFLMPNLSAI